MDRITELEAEIARLRAVCEEHDIDPDWVSSVPSISEAELIATTLAARSPGLVEGITRNNALLRMLNTQAA